MAERNWLEDLNEPQRKAVTYQPAPLLALAGPGSGKTRIITRRIAWLVDDQEQPPESILAVTFTNRAAEEMRERLFHFLGDRAEGVWIHTFHAAAMRILRKFGDRIGVPLDFVILDEDEQRLAIARQLRLLNLSREQYSVGEIAARIGQAKSLLMNPETVTEDNAPEMTEVIRAYEAWLRAHRMLDFDDLIRFAVQLLRQDEEVRDFYRRTLQHILVDEYQDINKAQYAFLTLLAPPGASITAVADDDQTIYGWRGSDPSFVDAFIQRYDPAIIKLPYSYRCPPSILYGAQHLIAREDKPDARRNFMQSRAEAEDAPIHHYIFRHVRQEQAWLITLIRKLMAERGVTQGDIAILYRTHRLGEPVEQALLEAGFHVQRVRPKSFFDRHQVREVVRYLQMARAVHEDDLTRVLNFPVHQIDELTMVQLRRLAQTGRISLIALMARVDAFPEITPLTRHHLQRLHDLARNQLPDLESDAGEAVKRIFAQLDALRSPWRRRDRERLARLFDVTRLPDDVARMRNWLDAGRAPLLLYEDGLDARLAAFLLQRILADYLRVDAAMAPAEGVDITGPAIFFGDPTHAPAMPDLITLPEQPQLPQTAWAWRLGQQLLLSYENLAQGRFIFYDVETTGPSVRRDELVEIAAWAYEAGQPAGDPFRTFVRPQRGYIPPSAVKVHGIRYDDVVDAPDIAEALPRFLDYIRDDILVGHNIARFDNRFIDKVRGEIEGKGFYPLYIDTLRLARRLLPDARSLSLERLSQSLGLHKGPIRHRALEDLQVNADLFYLLTEYLLAEKEQEALAEFLPLVGLSLLDGKEMGGEFRSMLLDGAARVASSRSDETLLDAFPPERQLSLMERMRLLAAHQPRRDEEDDDWEEMRRLFLAHVAAFKKYGRDHTLRAFLDYQALLNNADTFAHEAQPDAITLMTLHNAKGAEFPVVIIIGVEQENLPIWRSMNDPRKLAEERRVFYVGLTRAQKAVYLFSTNDREDGFFRYPSQFAFEIPPRYIRHYRIYPDGRVLEIKAARDRRTKLRKGR
ncbi:MAG TPA: UvrD-helicase domain-containing protein [Caldilineae bacterium]|nr:UvrD-helicase domain-containing protein [Caldilineae bacterium]